MIKDGFVKVIKVEEEKDFSMNNEDINSTLFLLVQKKVDIQSKIDRIAVKMTSMINSGVDARFFKDITRSLNMLFLGMNDDIEELSKIEAEVDRLSLNLSGNYIAVGIDEDFSRKERAM